MNISRITVVACLALAMHACASNGLKCSGGAHFATQEQLYFGTARNSGTVTPEEWAEFLRNAVTPRFPAGLSVWQASGQWRASDGDILREASYVLNLIHPDDAISEQAVLDIITLYKSRFQQEAVLRVKVPACVSL